ARPLRRAGRLRNAQRRVERAANLERAGPLNRFELQMDVRAGARQPVRSAQRCAQDAAADPRGGSTHVVQVNRHQLRRMSARFAANADRGRTWSAPALRAALMRSVWTWDAKPIVRTPLVSASAFSAVIVAMGSAFGLFRSMITSDGLISRACARI